MKNRSLSPVQMVFLLWICPSMMGVSQNTPRPLGITDEDFIKSQAAIRQELKIHQQLIQFKRKNKCGYHDDSVLQKSLSFLKDNSLPAFKTGVAAAETSSKKKFKSAVLQGVYETGEWLKKKSQEGGTYKDVVKKRLQMEKSLADQAMAQVGIDLDAQGLVKKTYDREMNDYLNQIRQDHGDLSQIKTWPKQVREDFEKRKRIQQSIHTEYRRIETLKDKLNHNMERIDQVATAIDHVWSVKESVLKQKGNLDAYRHTLENDDATEWDKLSQGVSVSADAVNEGAKGLKVLNKWIKDKVDGTLEDQGIYPSVEEALKGKDLKLEGMTPSERVRFFKDQDALLKNSEFLGGLQKGLDNFNTGYKYYEKAKGAVEKARGVLNDWDRYKNNPHMNDNAKKMAQYSQAVGTAMESLGDYLSENPSSKLLGEGLKLSGQGFRLIATSAEAGAAYVATTHQGGQGAKNKQGNRDPFHQGEQAFTTLLSPDHSIQQRFGVKLYQETKTFENRTEPKWIVRSSSGDETEIDPVSISKMSRALSRLESILGRAVTQDEFYELAQGSLRVRHFIADNDHYELDPVSLNWKTEPVDINYLAGKPGARQEFEAGRYYARYEYMDNAFQWVGESDQTFEALNEVEQLRLLRWSNRLNELYAMSGGRGELPASILGGMMSEIETARVQHNQQAEDYISRTDADQWKKLGAMTSVHQWLIRRLVKVMDHPDTPPDMAERIAWRLQQEGEWFGVDRLPGVNTADSPDLAAEPMEDDTSAFSGFQELNQGDSDEAGISDNQNRKVMVGDESVKEALAEDRRANAMSAGGRIGLSDRNMVNAFNQYKSRLVTAGIQALVESDLISSSIAYFTRANRQSSSGNSEPGTGEMVDGIELMNIRVIDEAGNFIQVDDNGNPLASDPSPSVPWQTDDGEFSGAWFFNTAGLPNPKDWGVIQYWNQKGPNAYVIRKYYEASQSGKGHRIIYGPQTFMACRRWLFEKGYW